jgi:hypothetical protein
MREEQEK